MKKIFTLAAVAAMAISANAAEVEVTDFEIDYTQVSSFPYYVMGYTPTFDAENGLMSSNPGEWYQYFVADGISTTPGTVYYVECEIKSSEAGQFNANMGWGWGEGEQVSGTIVVTTEWAKQVTEYTGVNGTSSNVVFQPGGFTGDICMRNLRVYHLEGESEGPAMDWKALVDNDFEADATGITVKENNGDFTSFVTPGVGVDGTSGIKVVSPAGAAQDWDTQLWITLAEDQWLSAGDKVKVEFAYKATENVAIDTQAHGNPGAYHYWQCAGTVNFTSEWQVYTKEFTVTADMASTDGFGSIAFNLSKDKENDVEFYFDDVKLSVWAEVEAGPTVVTVGDAVWGNVEEGELSADEANLGALVVFPDFEMPEGLFAEDCQILVTAVLTEEGAAEDDVDPDFGVNCQTFLANAESGEVRAYLFPEELFPGKTYTISVVAVEVYDAEGNEVEVAETEDVPTVTFTVGAAPLPESVLLGEVVWANIEEGELAEDEANLGVLTVFPELEMPAGLFAEDCQILVTALLTEEGAADDEDFDPGFGINCQTFLANAESGEVRAYLFPEELNPGKTYTVTILMVEIVTPTEETVYAEVAEDEEPTVTFTVTPTEIVSLNSINVENGKVVYNIMGQKSNANGIVIMNNQKALVK